MRQEINGLRRRPGNRATTDISRLQTDMIAAYRQSEEQQDEIDSLRTAVRDLQNHQSRLLGWADVASNMREDVAGSGKSLQPAKRFGIPTLAMLTTRSMTM